MSDTHLQLGGDSRPTFATAKSRHRDKAPLTMNIRRVASRVLHQLRPTPRAVPIFTGNQHGTRPALSLTFDDGPSEWTPEVLDLLAAHNAAATFFIVGSAVTGHENVLRRAVREGHELGNHTFSHSDPTTLTEEELRDELERTSLAIERAVSARPLLVRPPYCADPYRVARVAAAAGYTRTVLRSIDPADWQLDDADAIARVVIEQAVPGGIVCLHDGTPPRNRGLPTRQQTVEAVGLILPALIERNFQLVTVSQLLT